MIDLLGITGAALVVAGVAMVHVPSALVSAGVLMLSGAALAARRSS